MTTPPQDNIAIVRRFWEEVFGGGHFDVTSEILASDYVLHQPDAAGGDHDLAELETLVGRFREYYQAGFRVDVVEQFAAEGDRIVTRYTVIGTRLVDWPEPDPPVENIVIERPDTASVVMEGISISLVSDGRIAKMWVSWDSLGALRQEGLLGGLSADPDLLEPFWRWKWR